MIVKQTFAKFTSTFLRYQWVKQRGRRLAIIAFVWSWKVHLPMEITPHAIAPAMCIFDRELHFDAMYAHVKCHGENVPHEKNMLRAQWTDRQAISCYYMAGDYSEAWIKWPPFCRWHFLTFCRWHFSWKKCSDIFFLISLTYVLKGLINNKPALSLIIASFQTDDKPLHESMWTISWTNIGFT